MTSSVLFANLGVRAFGNLAAGLSCAAGGVVIAYWCSSAVAEGAASASYGARTVFSGRNGATARRGTFVTVAMESCVLISDFGVGAFLEFATLAARSAVTGVIISRRGSNTVTERTLPSPRSPRLVLSLFTSGCA